VGVNGKKKGNSWEREVAKIFTEAFGEDFRRVPMSGAFSGGINIHRVKGLRQDVVEGLTGDIISPKWFPYTVEAKNYADEPKFHQVIAGESKMLKKWIKQSKEELAATSKKSFLIIFKINRKGQFILMPKEEIPESVRLSENTLTLKDDSYKYYCIITLEAFLRHKDFVLEYKNGTQEETKENATEGDSNE